MRWGIIILSHDLPCSMSSARWIRSYLVWPWPLLTPTLPISLKSSLTGYSWNTANPSQPQDLCTCYSSVWPAEPDIPLAAPSVLPRPLLFGEHPHPIPTQPSILLTCFSSLHGTCLHLTYCLLGSVFPFSLERQLHQSRCFCLSAAVFLAPRAIPAHRCSKIFVEWIFTIKMTIIRAEKWLRVNRGLDLAF